MESDLKELRFLTALNFEDSAESDSLDSDSVTDSDTDELNDILSEHSSFVQQHPTENHVRDEIEEPENMPADIFKAPDSKDAAMSQEDDSAADEESGSGSGSEGESGSGSSNDTAKKEVLYYTFPFIYRRIVDIVMNDSRGVYRGFFFNVIIF